MEHKLLRSLIVKPVGSLCNMRCAYCFYLDKHRLYDTPLATHRMTDATLEKVMQDMFACSDRPTFIWHGGEPTLMGLPFFRKIVAMQRLYAKGKTYSNAIQTNGLLLNAEWADFLRQEGFLVGISLDGPEHVHDKYRYDAQDNGTFARVFENAKMLLKHGVQVNALASVTNYAARYPQEIYEFFVEHGLIFMQFSPVVEPDPEHPKSAAPYSVSAREYGSFLNQLFNLWVRDFDMDRLQQKTSIRFFDTLIGLYAGLPVDHCIFHQHCNDYLVVEHNGDLFSCDFLVSEETRIGNLHEMSLKEAFHSPAHVAFGKRKADYGTTCQRCQWLRVCEGGCIKDRLHDPRDRGQNHFCQSYKFFFQRTDARLRKFAALYQQHYLQRN
jgi:uncharacterized protein